MCGVRLLSSAVRQSVLLGLAGISFLPSSTCRFHAATRLASSPSPKCLCVGLVSIHLPTESIIVHNKPWVMTERMTETPRLCKGRMRKVSTMNQMRLSMLVCGSPSIQSRHPHQQRFRICRIWSSYKPAELLTERSSFLS